MTKNRLKENDNFSKIELQIFFKLAYVGQNQDSVVYPKKSAVIFLRLNY